jgi:uncharacterized membrane protein
MSPMMFIGLCGLFIILSIPLILAKVPPNGLYGFRTRKTMSDTAIWYKANKFLGYAIVLSSIVSLMVLLVSNMMPGLLPRPVFIHYANMVLIVPIIGALIASSIYVRKL